MSEAYLIEEDGAARAIRVGYPESAHSCGQEFRLVLMTGFVSISTDDGMVLVDVEVLPKMIEALQIIQARRSK
jgi:hypothetical protein